MYNKNIIEQLVQFINGLDGIGDKEELSKRVKKEFSLIQDRKVFSCGDFAIRFSSAKSKCMSNTVLSLSALQKYDNTPFFVCIVTPTTNYILLANTTFLKKISHSSLKLRIDNIRGSFNGGDIMMEFADYQNNPHFFEEMYAYHSGLSFQDNLERLVESTNGIVGRVCKFNVTPSLEAQVLSSITRAIRFVDSNEYNDLKNDLDSRVNQVQGEIAIAAFINNVNVRGRIIEYLITDNGSTLKTQIITALYEKSPLPQFKTKDNLGDYSKKYPSYNTETDIKTKVLFLDGNQKAYNVDKLLEFLSTEKSVYMIYLLGVDEKGKIVARFCSVFDRRLLEATSINYLWTGRNSRGGAQFRGTALTQILSEDNHSCIDSNSATDFLIGLISRKNGFEPL